MAAREEDSEKRIAPLRKLFHELDGNLVAREVTEMKGLLQDTQLERKVLERLNSANDIFIELESRGLISESNLDLLSDLFSCIKRDHLETKLTKFLETKRPSTPESSAHRTGKGKAPETSVKTSGTRTQEARVHQAPAITTKTLKKETLPRVLPLCYPDNYEWKRTEGVLEVKKKTRGKLVVCEDAINFLRSIDDFICPIAVIGPARSGKSYIASQLIEPRQQDCVFKTSCKMKPQIPAIWMSTDVFKKTLSNGTEVTVIILDTEGLDAYNAHKQDGLLMFALIALMSSILVYNSKGSPCGWDNYLSWVNGLVEIFSWTGSCPKKSTELENEFIKFFPNFIWLLRDVTMSFVISEDDHDLEVDFKDYLLAEVLKLEKEDDATEAKVKNLNATRRALLKYFPVFDALTLPIPTLEVSVLKEMGKGKNNGRLNKGFLKDVDVFITRCRALMKPKKAWSSTGNINGKQFAEMLQQCVSMYSETRMINVDAIVQSVIEAQLQQVVDLLFTDYRHDMDEYAKTALPCKNYEVIEKHNDCMYQAMRKFTENAKDINDADSLKKYRNALKEKLALHIDGNIVGGYLLNILDRNEKMSDEFCRHLVDELLIEHSKPGKTYSQQLSSGSSVDFLYEQYKERARGPQMWHVYKTVLAAQIEDISMSRRKEYLSFEDNGNHDTSVRVKAAEIQAMEKENTKKQVLAIENAEVKAIQAMMVEDINYKQRQSETDFEEISAALQAKIDTLTRTHEAVVKDLQLVLDYMRAEKKEKAEKLTGNQRK